MAKGITLNLQCGCGPFSGSTELVEACCPAVGGISERIKSTEFITGNPAMAILQLYLELAERLVGA
jgi:hypothetical protein